MEKMVKNFAYIYFIRELKDDGNMKIGQSKDPQKRLYSFRQANPTPLKLVAQFKCPTKYLNTTERWFHDAFKIYHNRGEWFKVKPYMLDYIKWLYETFGEDGFYCFRAFCDCPDINKRTRDKYDYIHHHLQKLLDDTYEYGDIHLLSEIKFDLQEILRIWFNVS